MKVERSAQALLSGATLGWPDQKSGIWVSHVLLVFYLANLNLEWSRASLFQSLTERVLFWLVSGSRC